MVRVCRPERRVPLGMWARLRPLRQVKGSVDLNIIREAIIVVREAAPVGRLFLSVVVLVNIKEHARMARSPVV